MYRIYKYTSPDGKVYIGCTTQSIKARAGIAGYGYAQCTRFWEAIKQFGWENFTCEVLEEVEDAELAAMLEVEYTLRYDSVNPEKGYNSRIQEYPFSDEIRAKLSAAIKASMTDEVKARRSAAVKAKLAEPEVRDKMREANRANLAKPEVKAKLAEANRRRFEDPAEAGRIKQSLADYWTEERREEWSELLREKFQDPEIRRRISEGTKAGIAARGNAARSKASKDKWADPEYKARVRASMKAAANTPEHRAKMSAVGIEVQNRPEVKAKLSASFKGLIFINNGTISKRVTEDEAQRLVATGEWRRGRLKPGKGSRGPIKSLQNRKWVHNSSESKFVPEAEYQSYLNQGWKPGRK